MLSFAFHHGCGHLHGVRLMALHEGCAIVERDFGAVVMRMAIPFRQFVGVLLSGDAQGLLRLSLIHRDQDLCLTLCETAQDDDLLAHFSEAARKFSLPRFVEPAPGQRLCLDQCMGAVVLGRAPIVRRRGQIAITRRPRFLVRRRLGDRRLMRKLT